MRKLAVVVLSSLALVVPMPGQALTEVAGCTTTSVPGTCNTGNFTCPPHTVNLRAIPQTFNFTGSVTVALQHGATTDSHTSEWVSGRIRTGGTSFKTVAPAPYGVCKLTVTTATSTVAPPLSGGSVRGVIDA